MASNFFQNAGEERVKKNIRFCNHFEIGIENYSGNYSSNFGIVTSLAAPVLCTSLQFSLLYACTVGDVGSVLKEMVQPRNTKLCLWLLTICIVFIKSFVDLNQLW